MLSLMEKGSPFPNGDPFNSDRIGVSISSEASIPLLALQSQKLVRRYGLTPVFARIVAECVFNMGGAA